MPIYSFICENGHSFEELLPLVACGKNRECPICHELARQVASLVAWRRDHTVDDLDRIYKNNKGNVPDDVKKRHSK